MVAPPRTATERKRDALARLEETEADAWVASAAPSGLAHLVPLSFAWRDGRFILAAEPSSLTVRNIEASGRARLGLGPTRDVLLVDAVLERVVESRSAAAEVADAYARQSGWDPRREAEPYVFVLLRPARIQAWREANELAGKVLMRDGAWLV